MARSKPQLDRLALIFRRQTAFSIVAFLLTLFCLLAAGVVCLTPVATSDLGWHLRAGRYIAQTRSIPRVDFMSWTKQGAAWVDFEWLSQLIFYGLDRAGGAALLWAFKSAGFGVILFLWTRLLALWRLPRGWIIGALPLAAVTLLAYVEARPELFSFCFALVELRLLESLRLGLRRDWRRMGALHLVGYALWANLHAGFLVGFGLCAVYALGAWCGGKAGFEDEPEPSARPRCFLGLLGWALLGSIGTPYGLATYGLLWRLWLQHGEMAAYILEWMPPILSNAFERGYWVIVLLSFGTFLTRSYYRRQSPATHVLLLLLVSLAACRTYRMTAYVCLIVLPVALRALYDLPAPAWWRRIKYAALTLGAAALMSTEPRLLAAKHLFEGFKESDRLEPAGGCAFLKREKDVLAPLRLYNSWNWGGYLDYALGNDFRTFIDGRYLFTEFLPEIDSINSEPGLWYRFLDAHGIELAFTETKNPMLVGVPGQSPPRPFLAVAMPKQTWALVYFDHQASIWVRRARVPGRWLKKHEFRFLIPRDLMALEMALRAGRVGVKPIVEEIVRYRREIGDPEESQRLQAWLAGLKPLPLQRHGP